MTTTLFTPSAVLDMLSQIDEFSDMAMDISETVDGQISLRIGDSTYYIENKDENDIQVDDAVVDEVDDINIENYENLGEGIDVLFDAEPVESGLIKEIAKTLLIGGMVRLTGKLLKK